MHELYYWIALRLICGIGNVLYRHVLDRFGSPERVFQASRDELLQIEGMHRKTAEALRSFRPNDTIDREIDRIHKNGVHVITYTSSLYPQNLKNIYDPPPYLYVKGRLTQQDSTAVAIVGSRHASAYGMRAAEEIGGDLASAGITIVSGMARGIDSCAHKAALMRQGRTLAVLGCGVDVVYPPENRKLYDAIASCGAVVSEYPMGTEPQSYNFPARNRIISGLSQGVLVAEASPKSGSLITARLALDQGRDVFAVPGNIYSFKTKGTHSLLKNGAKLVEHARDIIEELPSSVVLNKNAPTYEDSACISALSGTMYHMLQNGPVHIDDLIVESALSSSEIAPLLLDLELKGKVKQLPGKRFVLA